MFGDALPIEEKNNQDFTTITKKSSAVATRAPRPNLGHSDVPALPVWIEALIPLVMNSIKTTGVTTSSIVSTGPAILNALNVVKNAQVQGDLTVFGHAILKQEPTANDHATTKLYVDTVAGGLRVKMSCCAAANSNQVISGIPPLIDDVSLVAGDRVLLVQQVDARENGIWVVNDKSWQRPSDFAVGSNASSAFTFIQEGTIYADTGWVCTNNFGHAQIDSDNLTFTQFSGPGAYTMSNLPGGSGLVYKEAVGSDFRLRSLKHGNNMVITTNVADNYVTIATDNKITLTNSDGNQGLES